MIIQKYKITINVTCLASPSSTGCETRWETSLSKIRNPKSYFWVVFSVLIWWVDQENPFQMRIHWGVYEVRGTDWLTRSRFHIESLLVSFHSPYSGIQLHLLWSYGHFQFGYIVDLLLFHFSILTLLS